MKIGEKLACLETELRYIKKLQYLIIIALGGQIGVPLITPVIAFILSLA